MAVRAAWGTLASGVLTIALVGGLAVDGVAATATSFCEAHPVAPRPARGFEGDSSAGLAAADLWCRTPGEIRVLAARYGLEGHGRPDVAGQYRKFRDPDTDVQRLRLDQGHVDRETGRPYDDPRARVPHVHGYTPAGDPIRDPATGNTHFPLRTR
ncbi:MAG: hypothetical protein ACT4QG_14215 [Sporichthyaceae bacterium]